jgi:O-antigen/teichoic acid export membrane protein
MKTASKRSSFFKNILTLFSGTAIAQALPILLSPVLSRIYTPLDFAILAIITPIITIGATISTLRFDIAVVVPKENSEAKTLLSTALITNILITVLSALCVFVFQLTIPSNTLLSDETRKLLWYIPPGIFSIGWYTAYNYWSTRNKTYRNNAASKIIQAIVTIITSIAFGYFIPGAEGLILGLVAGYMIGLIVLYARQKQEVPLSDIQKFSLKNAKKTLKKYKDFIFINTPHAVLGIFADYGIVYFLKIFFINNIIGGFSFAYRYTKAPLGIITSSISQVFYEEASKKVNAGEDIRPLMYKIQKNLFLLSFPFFVIFIIWAPDIFAFVFSKAYYQAGEIAALLFPWIYLNFLISPISGITIILNKQKEALILSFLDLALRVAAICIGGAYGDWEFTFLLLSFFYTIYFIFVSWWYYKISDPCKLKQY